MEVAPGESQVEWPLETGGPALEVRPEVPVERVDLAGVLDRLDVAEAPEAGCLDALRPPQVLDEHDPLLRPRDQNVAEGRREDVVGDEAAPEVGETRFESFARNGHVVGRE